MLILKLHCNELMTFVARGNKGADFPLIECLVQQESPMADKKNFDERSERAIPLSVEGLIVEGARKRKQFNPEDENEALKKDGSDLDTIRGDL